jgi:hypothetical protein
MNYQYAVWYILSHTRSYMKITNNTGLPVSVLNAIKRPEYTKGKANMSVTELISSPRITQLKRRHWSELEEDASSMVWSLFGSAIHKVLEHGKADNHIIEQRLFAQVDGWTISGAIDLQEYYEDGIIVSDYKTTGSWAATNGKDDWERQLNIYAFLVEYNKKIPVTKLQIVAIVRDWSAREAAYKEDYPKAPIVVIPIPLWPMEQRIEFIRSRISAHSEAEFASDTGEELPECTPSEMWEKQASYAVIKEGNVRAKAVYSTMEDAEAGRKELKDPDKYVIQVRPGERTRCAGYCQISKFCTQYQRWLDQQATRQA